MKRAERSKFSLKMSKETSLLIIVRQELLFESNGKEKFALLILTLITRHTKQLLLERALVEISHRTCRKVG